MCNCGGKKRTASGYDPEKDKDKDSYINHFHKALEHNSDGTLKYPEQYQDLVKAILENDISKLASIKLSPDAKMLWVNPTAANAKALVGAKQSTLKIDVPAGLSTKELAA